MVIRSKLPPWSIALSLSAFLVTAIGSRPVRADPLTDSFASGGKVPAHKPAKKKGGSGGPGKAPTRGSHGSGAKPAHGSSPGKPRVSGDKVPDRAGAETESASPPPRREPPEEEERPRSRRAAEPEEVVAPAAPNRRTSRDGDEAHADEEEKPGARKAAPRRPIVTKSGASNKKAKAKRGEDEEEQEEGDQGEGDQGEEEEHDTDDDAPFASLPSIVPRAFTLGLGVALMGRNFQFGAPAMLQRESSFPRLGFVADLEAFPLLPWIPRGWWRQLGVGAFYAAEPSGQAAVTDPASGMSINTPVKQARWGIDLRLAIPIGEHLVLIPRLGLQAYSFTLSTKMPIMASACTSTMTVACLPDTDAQTLALGGIARIGATPDLGFSLSGAYLVGLGVTNRPINQIGYEIATSVSGFALEGGASWRLADWIALRASVPFTRLGYAFHPSTSPPTPATVTYRSATELVYGFSVGVAVFTK